MAMTNEERFLASCATAGEADVRQKLGAGRYSERRAEWAAGWLDQADNGKSDAARAAERSSRLRASTAPKPYRHLALGAVAVSLLIGSTLVFLDVG